eukprot:TRINITY_DN2011_c0_g1_i1.p2 TRINITY_DN2011_c0_g1~~TRINITY_DN2011_c0_g1_i1.p2  ORF type:complete len:224 (-),score=59.20 TRINITY_DN2011_c0_g1_i1:39-710(-)
MRSARWLRAAAIFQRTRQPKTVQEELTRATLPPRVEETVFASVALLDLLKSREYLSSWKFDFAPLPFLVHARHAYVTVVKELHGDRSRLSELLPESLVTAITAYLKEPDSDRSCIPALDENVAAQISDIRYSVEPPEHFPAAHPFSSLWALLTATLLSPARVRDEWAGYLERCAEWYRTNVLTVDVLFFVLESGGGQPAAKGSHLWTFQRELSGEWNIVDMDH